MRNHACELRCLRSIVRVSCLATQTNAPLKTLKRIKPSRVRTKMHPVFQTASTERMTCAAIEFVMIAYALANAH